MLSSKLRADYIEMINNVLDNIKVNSPEDIQTAKINLQNLVSPVEGFVYSQQYRELIDFIANYFETPENYVEIRQNDDEFRQLIRDRVAAKIIEFDTLNATQKAEYIQAQQRQRNSAAQIQREMALKRAPVPGSEAHVLTEQQMLAQMQHTLLIEDHPLIPQDVQEAIAHGIITLTQYLQIPDDERPTMAYLFDDRGRAALGAGIITLERYLQIPHNERSSMRYYLFDENGRAALIAGIITIEQYLEIPRNERFSMEYLFDENGRAAFAAEIITLEQYLQIPCNDRASMQYLFAPEGRSAITEGIITLKQYLQIPIHERIETLNNIINSASSSAKPT